MKGIKGIKSIRESFKTRQVKYGGYAVLITLAVIAGLILVNLLAGQFPLQLDMTENKRYSLSEQTLQVLDQVKTPVTFYGLWQPGEENQDIMPVINLYTAKNRSIRLELIDPDKNPGFVAKYDKDKRGIPRGSLIVEGDKGFRVIAPYDMYDFSQSQQGGISITGTSVESRITSAILFAGTGDTPAVYEITGHSETPLSYLGIAELMERENYTLQPLNLLVAPVPSDASLIILNNPRGDLAAAEAEKLLDYLGQGGRLLVLADYTIGELSNLNEVFASYGFKFEFGILHETDPQYVAIDPRTEWPDLTDHDITKPLMDKSRTPVVLVEAMPLSMLNTTRRSVEIKPLMTSSASSFLRTDLNDNSQYRAPSDISGPLTLGVAVTDPSWIQGNEPQARIVAIGSGSLLPIAMQGFDANRDLFMNSVAWLQDRPETISVRSKSLFLLPLRLNLVQIIIFAGLFVFIIPMAFFVTGFITWLKRRHL
ncbi:GldG family protein [Treponema sp. OttesenSCG-928-L16]|nr:GldG family protein [Treponema sp. OttesenSCG-928-L16]